MDTTMNLSESRQHEILVVAWTMTGLAIFTVAIKLFARAQIVRVIGWDDIFIVFSLVSSLSIRTHEFGSTTDLTA